MLLATMSLCVRVYMDTVGGILAGSQLMLEPTVSDDAQLDIVCTCMRLLRCSSVCPCVLACVDSRVHVVCVLVGPCVGSLVRVGGCALVGCPSVCPRVCRGLLVRVCPGLSVRVSPRACVCLCVCVRVGVFACLGECVFVCAFVCALTGVPVCVSMHITLEQMSQL